MRSGGRAAVAVDGWDAAGKGGLIQRLIFGLEPRSIHVWRIGAPTDYEKNRHYLWRFWTRLPERGNWAVFDRTWYGRVLVERIEGFCTKAEWKRAYREINEFERPWPTTACASSSCSSMSARRSSASA
jgi:polyphosphate kinase 2 (PPK2 family)